MGIKGLGQWIRKTVPEAVHTVPLKLFGGQRVAVDASVYLYKFVCVSNSMRGNYFDMFLNLILWLRHNNIRPVFVFDGPPPPQKDRTKQERKAQKVKLENKVHTLEELLELVNDVEPDEDFSEELQARVDSMLEAQTRDWSRKKVFRLLSEKYKKVASQCIYITKEHTENIKNLLTYVGLPWIQSEYEAEKTCSWLCFHGYTKAVITTDSDIMAYGAPIWLTDVKANGEECRLIRHEDILTGSELTKEQFTDFCIMCGTDYNTNIPGVGPMKAYSLVRDYGSLDEISKTTVDTSVLYYEEARTLFTLPDDSVEFTIPPMSKPNWEAFSTLLFKTNSRFSVGEVQKRLHPPRKGKFIVKN